MKITPRQIATLMSLSLLTTTSLLQADEGMWLFNNPPRQQLKEKYGFDATDAWLEHVQKSSVRFNSGGSGSFVSADGLVMSNHHVGADCLQKLSDQSITTTAMASTLVRGRRKRAATIWNSTFS